MNRAAIDWTPERLSRLEALAQQFGRTKIARTLSAEFGETVTIGMVSGLITRRNLHRPVGGSVRGLSGHHPAVSGQRTLFVTRVREVPPKTSHHQRNTSVASDLVLKPGAQATKLGRRIEKGPWSGMPIYSLTLEERATCPVACHNFRTCYGNTSPFAVRYRHGPELEARIETEIAELAWLHPGGFVVRLHQLGDFYSVNYVRLWADWLRRFPALRVFGYTAWPSTTPIGAAVLRLAALCWSRFAVRLSSAVPGPGRAVTLRAAAGPGVIVCPAQLGRTRSCGTCGLCWAPAARERTIAFLAHGL